MTKLDNNGSTGPIILIVILSLAVLSLTGYIVYDKVIDKEEKSKVEEKKTEESKNEKRELKEELDIQSELVQNLYKKIDVFKDYYSGNNFGYIFKENLLSSNISNQVKLHMAFANLNLGPINSSIRVDASDLKKSMSDLFGDIKYTDESIDERCTFPFDYSSNQKVYYIEAYGCGGTLNPMIVTKLISATKTTDVIELYQKIYYKEVDQSSIKESDAGKLKSNLYTLPDKEKFIDSFIDDDNFTSEQLFNEYSKYLNTYKYIFNYDKDTDKYYFYSVEKVEK